MLRSFIKGTTTTGVYRALRDLREEFRIQRRHRGGVKRARRYSGSNAKLNIGCGTNLKEGWVNVDLFETADLQLDLREPLPFPDGSVSMIYSEHFFEHLEFPDDALNFLKESLRVLQPGGLFSVGVPDTEWPIKSYASEDNEHFRLAQRWLPAWCNTTPMHDINYHFRQGREHKYAYDFETLSRILNDAGFVSTVRRSFDPSLDSASRQPGTLYVDAYKPKSALDTKARQPAG